MTECTGLTSTLDEPAPSFVSTIDAGNGPAAGKCTIPRLPGQRPLPRLALQRIAAYCGFS